jgi:hypothetical protein
MHPISFFHGFYIKKKSTKDKSWGGLGVWGCRLGLGLGAKYIWGLAVGFGLINHVVPIIL